MDDASCAKSALRGNGDNFFAIDDRRPWTHLRLNIYPDGGVARLRVYGEVAVDWQRVAPRQARRRSRLDHATAGWSLGASDMHYGAKDNMIMPGRAENMGDGWETRRRRGPATTGRSSASARRARVAKIEIDTNHYKGNYPDSASLEGCFAPGATLEQLRDGAVVARSCRETKLVPHHRHYFSRKQLRTPAGVARAAEHLSRRRRQPAARPWNRRTA